MRELYTTESEFFREFTDEDRVELRKELSIVVNKLKIIETKLGLFKHKTFEYIDQDGEAERINDMFYDMISI
jgi:hypothetical protein